MTFKATGDTTGGKLLLFENLTTPGSGAPPHIHTHEDEFFFVLDKERSRSGSERSFHVLGAGGYAYVPLGDQVWTTSRNVAETQSRILVDSRQAGIEGFFREAGRSATDDGPAPPLDDDEVARTMAASWE